MKKTCVRCVPRLSAPSQNGLLLANRTYRGASDARMGQTCPSPPPATSGVRMDRTCRSPSGWMNHQKSRSRLTARRICGGMFPGWKHIMLLMRESRAGGRLKSLYVRGEQSRHVSNITWQLVYSEHTVGARFLCPQVLDLY